MDSLEIHEIQYRKSQGVPKSSDIKLEPHLKLHKSVPAPFELKFIYHFSLVSCF